MKFPSPDPFRGFQELGQARRERKLLGEIDDANRTPEDEMAFQRNRELTRRAMLRLGIFGGLLAGSVGGAIIGGLMAARELAKSKSRSSSPLIPLEEFTSESDDTSLEIFRKAGIDHAEIARRKRLCANPSNKELLMKIEPAWRIYIQRILEILKEQRKDSYARILYEFYKAYGQPLIFVPPDTEFYLEDGKKAEPNTVVLFNNIGRGFSYVSLHAASRPEDKNHEWFQEQNIPYYNPENESLYIILPSHPDKDQEEARSSDMPFQASDIWFALHDAMSHQLTGQIQLSDPAMVELQSIDFRRRKSIMYDISQSSSFEMLIRKLHAVAERVALELKPPNPSQYIRQMTYRFARSLLMSNEPALANIRPHLEHIVRNPHIIQ